MLLVSVMLLCAAPLVGRNRTFSDAIFLSISRGVNPCRRKRSSGFRCNEWTPGDIFSAELERVTEVSPRRSTDGASTSLSTPFYLLDVGRDGGALQKVQKSASAISGLNCCLEELHWN